MSFGVGQSMNKSVKANLKLKGKRIIYFERTVQKTKEDAFTFSDQKEFSPEEFVRFRDKLKKEKQQLFIKRISITILSFIAILIMLLVLNII